MLVCLPQQRGPYPMPSNVTPRKSLICSRLLRRCGMRPYVVPTGLILRYHNVSHVLKLAAIRFVTAADFDKRELLAGPACRTYATLYPKYLSGAAVCVALRNAIPLSRLYKLIAYRFEVYLADRSADDY